ncbi:MAG: CHAT domain-containing protein [Flavobacteriales bacterium]
MDPEANVPAHQLTGQRSIVADSLQAETSHLLEDGNDTVAAITANRNAAVAYLQMDPIQPAGALRCYASICSMTNSSILADTGRLYARKADELIQREQPVLNDTDASYIFRNIALILGLANELDKAHSYALSALDRATHSGRLEDLDRSRDILATVYKQMGDFPHAVELEKLYLKSIHARFDDSLDRNPTALRWMGNGQQLLGDCFKFMGQLDSSIYHTKLGLHYTQRSEGNPSMRSSVCAINLANSYLYQGFYGKPAGYDSTIRYANLSLLWMPLTDAQRPKLASQALMWKALAFQALELPDSAQAAALACPRPWLAKNGAVEPIDWNSANAPTMEEFDGWQTIVQNMFMVFGDTSAIPWAIRLGKECFEYHRTMARNLDPDALRREYGSRVIQNNQAIRVVAKAKKFVFDPEFAAALFEERKGDQMRKWKGVLEGGAAQDQNSRSTYQNLLAERSRLNQEKDDVVNVAALAAINHKIDSVSRVLKMGMVDNFDNAKGDVVSSTQAAIDDSTLVVSYAWADDYNGSDLMILSVSKDGVDLICRRNAHGLDSLLNLYAQALHANDATKQRVLAEELGDSLLPRSIASGRYKRLVVIPDGPLNNLPFETLIPVGTNGRYLMDIAEVRYEYGMCFLKPENRRNTKADGLLAVAPTYDSVAIMKGQHGAKSLISILPGMFRDGVAPLKENIPEARHLAESYSALALTGPDATESEVDKDIGSYNVLHFASHAICSDSLPELSGILLSGAFSESAGTSDTIRSATIDPRTDNILHAYEIRSMDLSADLVVLSACETGIGQMMTGEGAMSLARAFRFAGVPNIVSSLWKVDDLATKQIMVKFYEKLAEGMGKADALAAAKQWYRAEYPNEPPSKWAAFILIGDNEPVLLQKRARTWPWMAGGALLVLTIVLAVNRRKRHLKAA